MRKTSLFHLTALLFISFSSFAQDFTFPKPASGKALVIFMTTGKYLGTLQFFDSTQFLGEIHSKEYLTYECDPGKRVLWSHGQQRVYLEADLAADQVYIIHTFFTTIGWGNMQSRQISLHPYDPLDKKADKLKARYLKSLQKKHAEIKYDPSNVQKLPLRIRFWIKDWTYDYHRKKQKHRKIPTLPPEMHI